MITCNVPFCDWLTVTYSSEDSHSVLGRLGSFLPTACLFHIPGNGPDRVSWIDVRPRLSGKAQHVLCLMTHLTSHNLIISVTGAGMEYFREHDNGSRLNDLMSILSEHHHNLTRCDISMDLDIDTPDFFLNFLPKVSSGYFAIRRDNLPVTRIINVRDDGQESGTIYIGKGSSARVKCTIYDKQLERLKRREIIESRTRIEFKLGKEFGASLYDVMAPDSLFWELAHPKILNKKPSGISKWIKREGYSRMPQPRVKREINHFDVLKELIYENPLIPTIIGYSDKHLGGSGRQYLINTIIRLIKNPAMGMDVSKSNDDN